SQPRWLLNWTRPARSTRDGAVNLASFGSRSRWRMIPLWHYSLRKWIAAAAIALAYRLNSPLLIVDDMAGRRLAKRLGLTITGTVGVVLAAAERGFIGDPFALLEDLRTQGGLWLSAAFLENLRSAWQPPV
ncbi:MAG: hypothetical protein WBM40_15230, partial [Thiohalocapsa sp.]